MLQIMVCVVNKVGVMFFFIYIERVEQRVLYICLIYMLYDKYFKFILSY